MQADISPLLIDALEAVCEYLHEEYAAILPYEGEDGDEEYPNEEYPNVHEKHIGHSVKVLREFLQSLDAEPVK